MADRVAKSEAGSWVIILYVPFTFLLGGYRGAEDKNAMTAGVLGH